MQKAQRELNFEKECRGALPLGKVQKVWGLLGN